MAKLTMGTDGAFALQRAIQSELAQRGYSSESDPVMAEYITIMVINDKTADQINGELADLIGPDYESNFTDWLFAETAKAAAPAASVPPVQPSPSDPGREDAPHASRTTGPGASLIQNALAGVHPPTGPSASRPNASLAPPTAQKRSFSARSPSPSSSSQPPKARRTDAPIGPRAMMDRERGTLLDRPLQAGNPHPNGRSLLDRVGPHNRRGGHNNGLSPAQVSHIQAKIDGITGIGGPRHHMNGRGGGPMPPMNGGPAMNPLAMQEMLAMQMNLMAQMAANMGMIQPGAQAPGGFPQQNAGGFPQQQQQQQQQQQNGGFGNGGGPGFQQQRGRGGAVRGGQGQGRGGMGGPGRGRGGSPNQFAAPAQPQPQQPQPSPAPAGQSTGAPERPGTPSLCKYSLKCTNPQCRFSHPSPVATVESGVVLSTEFCPNGKACKDKHCTLGHVSPSVVNGAPQKPPQTHAPAPAAPTPPPAASSPTPCKFGLACTRPGCMFTHPPNFRPHPHPHPHPSHHHQPAAAVPCRFGASCTRGDCPFQHPKGHVSANMFYRGLGPDAPLVEGYVSPHRSVRFGANAEAKAGAKEKAQQQETEKKDEKEVEAVALGGDKGAEKTTTVGVGA